MRKECIFLLLFSGSDLHEVPPVFKHIVLILINPLKHCRYKSNRSHQWQWDTTLSHEHDRSVYEIIIELNKDG